MPPLSDLQRAQHTDLVTLALLKLVQSPDSEKLQGRPWESKEMRELEVQVDILQPVERSTVSELTEHPVLQA